jgi:ABC-type nitrate/sulfonate/bicarbonate transport system substrate-binding protein
MFIRCLLAIGLAACVSGNALAQALPKVTVGDNPSLSGAPLYLAIEKGYYREAGVDVQLEMSGTVSDMAVMLAQNRLNVIGGAITAGFYNSLHQGLPIGLLMSRATSPFSHYLMIRPELKDKLKQASDLKGRSIAVVSRGAFLVYDLVKILESGGLTLADVDLKFIPFSQMATALTTGAVDAAVMISPLQDAVAAKGLGVKWINADTRIKVQPVMVSLWEMNADWARRSEDVARRFVRGTLRGARLLQRVSPWPQPRGGHARAGQIFRREGRRHDRSDRMGRHRCARPHSRGKPDGHAGDVLQGEARLRQGRDREDRAACLGERSGGEPRPVQARPR